MLRKSTSRLVIVGEGTDSGRRNFWAAVGISFGRCRCSDTTLARDGRPRVFGRRRGIYGGPFAELRGAIRRGRGALLTADPPHARNFVGFDRGLAAFTFPSEGRRFYSRRNPRPADAPALDGRCAVRSAGAGFGSRMGRKEKSGADRGNDRDRAEDGAGRDERGGSEIDQSLAQGNALRGEGVRAIFTISESGRVRLGANDYRRAGSEGRGKFRARDGGPRLHGHYRRR